MRKILIAFLFFAFFLIYLKYTIFYIDNLDFNKVYSLKILANKKSLKVLKVNNKDVNKVIYLKNTDNLKYGYYNITYDFKNSKIVKINESYVNKYRNKLIKIIDENYENKGLKAFINAILIGNKSYLSDDMNEKFKYLSISHLIVISGLHVSILRKFLEKYINFNRSIKNILIWMILTIYSIFIGFSTSIKRVYIMNSLDLFLKKTNQKENFLLSMLVILSLNIYEFKNPSFIFSYLSVFVIFFIHPLVDDRIKNKYIKMISLPILIQIFLLPFNIYFLKNIPILAFLANLLLIPISEKFLLILIINLCFNILKIDIFNFLIEYTYIAYETIILILYEIKYMSINI